MKKIGAYNLTPFTETSVALLIPCFLGYYYVSGGLDMPDEVIFIPRCAIDAIMNLEKEKN